MYSCAVTSGFAAEWVLLQSLIHGDGTDDVLLAVLLPITVAVVGLTPGLFRLRLEPHGEAGTALGTPAFEI